MMELKSTLAERGLEVWSTRVSLATVPSDVPLSRVLKILEGSVPRDVLVSLGRFTVADARVRELFDALMQGYYAYVATREWGDVARAAELLVTWSKEPYEHMTRVGLDLLGDPGFVSPYFPISQTPAHLTMPYFSASLLLPRLLVDAHRREGEEGVLRAMMRSAINVYRALKDEVTRLNGRGGLLGLDLSLSPWMEESVAEVVEMVGGCRLGTLRCVAAAYAVNSMIRRVSAHVERVIGFNELMLAVGEDNLLKRRVSEGEVTVRSLTELVPVCLAGVDMVAIKATKEELLDLLLALKSYAESKGRTIGFRAILLPKDFSDNSVQTERFGEIPVIEWG